MNLWAQLIEQLLDDRSVSTGRREYQLTCIDRGTFHLIGQLILAAIYQLVWYGVVEALWVFLSQVLGEDIVASAGQAIATHTTIVLLLVSSLTGRGQTHDDITRTDVGIVDDIAALHAASHGRVNDDGAYKVAHVCGLTTSRIDADAHLTHLVEELIGTIDDGGDYLARYEHLVASDGRRDEDVVNGTYTEQVVGVHHHGILSDSLPDGEVASFLPIHVSQARLGTCTIGVHDVTILRVAAQDVWYNLAESLWEDTLVDVLDGVVHIFFCCAHTAHHISIVAHFLNLLKVVLCLPRNPMMRMLGGAAFLDHS